MATLRELEQLISELQADVEALQAEISLVPVVLEHRAEARRIAAATAERQMLALPAPERNAALVEKGEGYVFGLLRRIDTPTAISIVREAPADLHENWFWSLTPDVRAIYEADHVYVAPKMVRVSRSQLAIAANWVWDADRRPLTAEQAGTLLAIGGEDYYSGGRLPMQMDAGDYLVTPKFAPWVSGYLMPVAVLDFVCEIVPDLRGYIDSGHVHVDHLDDEDNRALLIDYLKRVPASERRALVLRKASTFIKVCG